MGQDLLGRNEQKKSGIRNFLPTLGLSGTNFLPEEGKIPLPDPSPPYDGVQRGRGSHSQGDN